VVTVLATQGRRTTAARFADFCASVVRRLPFGLSAVVAPSFLGFALVNTLTFGVDLALISLFHDLLGWPVWLAITLGYVTAFGLSFVLNRWLNFRSHAPVGRQLGIYVVVVVINYAAILLGVGAGLAALGVNVQLARIIAGACEAVFVYSSMRWVVFAGGSSPSSAAKSPRQSAS